MSDFGVALITVGVLSAVLPMFGRQFMLMSFVGMTGLGSALAGILLIGIGLAFFLVGQKRKRQRQSRGLPTQGQDVKRS
jgi:hypothetical protein